MAEDWARMAELVWKYRDLPLGSVDASVIVAAERLVACLITSLLKVAVRMRGYAPVKPGRNPGH